MVRMQSDQPGPGQDMARRGIQVAKAGIIDRGAQVRIEWVPGHAEVPGNEFADQPLGVKIEVRVLKEHRLGDVRLSGFNGAEYWGIQDASLPRCSQIILNGVFNSESEGIRWQMPVQLAGEWDRILDSLGHPLP